MKVTYNWLKDFVAIKIKPQALADKLTMAGLEVTSLEERLGDFVFEIEITSNRPDWLSVIGIAREIAAITGKKLSRYPVIPLSRFNRQTGKSRMKQIYEGTLRDPEATLKKSLHSGQANRLTITIEDKKDCPLYNAKIIRDVKVGSSPEWLRKRLELIGCRSINNIVDITNYIMFTWGQPLHAFDLDKIVSPLSRYPVNPVHIIVRRAKKAEEILTIDGIRRVLDEDMLVIASAANRQTGKQANRQTNIAIAMAGVMGGKDSEVSNATRNVLLEAAVFNPILIRHARKTQGIQSESAYRFERTVDSDSAEKASQVATELMGKIAQGEYVANKTARSASFKRRAISLNISTAQNILGVDIPAASMKRILNDLGFKAKSKKNTLVAEIPSYRPDVNLEMDLIEEIARVFGYENIPTTLPKVSPCVAPANTRSLVSLMKDILAGMGLYEVITYSLADKESGAGIEILNPLSQEQEILRSTAIPALVKCVAYNLNQKQDYVNIFEIAHVFSESHNKVKEEPVLGIALCGHKSLLLEQGLIKDESGILHLKGILETLFIRLGIKEYGFKGVSASEISIDLGGERVGVIAQLNRRSLEKFEIKNQDVFVAEVFLAPVFSRADLEKKFMPLPLYPGINRDISMVLKEEIRAGQILQALIEKGGSLLREARISDYYKGKQIPAGYKGLTISCFYRSDERTLTESEITPIHQAIVGLLQDRFSIKIR